MSDISKSISDEGGSSWAQLQMSPKALGSMPYGNFRINVYEHADNFLPAADPKKKRYFYAPIALLDHESATCSYNDVTKQVEMRFRIEMWNERVEKEVVEFIGDLTEAPVKPARVQVIPFEKLILATSSPSNNYQLSKEWTPYQLHNSLWFTLTCFTAKDGLDLVNCMRTTPEEFSDLKLLFSLASQTSQTRETVIRVESIALGDMAATLNQRYPNQNEALLSAQDEKRLLAESSTKVIVETFDDSDVVSTTSEAQIYNILKDLLISSKTTIKDQTDKMWDSVFWNDDNYRPDKTAKTWNEVYEKLEKEDQLKLSDSFTNTNKTSVSAEANVMGLASVKTGLDVDFSRAETHSKDEMNRLFDESKDNVQWDGEKFVPKPLSLSRVNLTKLRDSQSLHDRKVNVRYSTAILSIAVNFSPNSDLKSNNQLFDLQTQLEGTKTEVEFLKKEMSSMSTNIQNYIIDTNTEMAAMKKEMSSKSESILKYINDSVDKPVIFDVFRLSNFSSAGSIITYCGTNVNIGSGMDISNGIFTAPVAGIYSFEFHALGRDGSSRVKMQLNGKTKTTSYSYMNPKTSCPLSMNATLQLDVGDKVSVLQDLGHLYDNSHEMFTHFSGRLL